jgi:hypothetical protein
VAPGGGFTTEGPSGHAKIDFILNYNVGASIGLDLPIFGEIPVIGFNPHEDLSRELINLDSTNLAVEKDLGFGLQGSMTWPNLTTTGAQSSTNINSFVSTGQSNDFLHITADIDDALAEIFLGGVNPFDIHVPYDLELVDGTIDIELLDLDLFAGLNFVQNFNMLVNGLMGKLTFENNQIPAADLNFNGGTITLTNASSYDLDGDGIEFAGSLTPVVSLANSTSVVFTGGYNFDILKGQLTYDAGIAGSDTIRFGPVVDLGGSLDIAAVQVYQNTFPLDFQPEGVAFSV